jgi:hypothetical protein
LQAVQYLFNSSRGWIAFRQGQWVHDAQGNWVTDDITFRPVKEQLLSDGDRAALQGLIPLAGALGAGTIFALFFVGRRRGSGIAVFELFAIVAVLVSVGTTAYLALALLHREEAINDHVLTQTATPLIFAVFLLVLVSVLARLPARVERIFSVLPVVLIAGLIAAWLASSSWSFEPDETVLMAALILGVGGITALLAWSGERWESRWDRGIEQSRFVRLSVAGYEVAERELRFALPGDSDGGAPLSCWTRKNRVYLDSVSCRKLGAQTRARWDQLAEDRRRLPTGPTVLIRVEARHYLLAWVCRPAARLWTFEPGTDEEPRLHELEANEEGLFDVTELRIV